MFKRTLNLKKAIGTSSAFLFGPRGVGKSFWIHEELKNAFVIDLLDSDIYQGLLRRPRQLEEMIPRGTSLVVIDEVQKLPELLDSVHRLIEASKIRFLLTGSSARKLRRGGANLLGGRARELHLFPLTSNELANSFDLTKYLNTGGLPRVVLSKEPELDLKSYVNLYLIEEIKAEALVRKFDQFVRFLDAIALTNGEELHYANLSNDSGVSQRTLEGYIQVLDDTLIGFQVLPFLATKKRKAITRSKFYFFDLGVTNFLANRGEIKPASELFGRALEHFIALELRAYLSYLNRRMPLCYWRTKNGFEVDFVIGNQVAIEVKASRRISDQDLRSLKALREEKKVKNYIVVCQEPIVRISDGIKILPINSFLKALWSGGLEGLTKSNENNAG